MLLALGATRLEATREVVQRAARVALTPLLNTMNVVVSCWLASSGWRRGGLPVALPGLHLLHSSAAPRA